MPMTPGYYTPNWYYPSVTPTQPIMPQQSFAQAPTQSNTQGMLWVDGEVGAKAYQMPAGWPVNTPLVLWDMNEPVFYIKSLGPNGVPNPVQKAHYTMDEANTPLLPAGQSGKADPMLDKYVTKDDLHALKEELREMLKQNSQNGSNNPQNRGGNR